MRPATPCGACRADQAPQGQPTSAAALRALRLTIELDLGRGGADHLAQASALAEELRQAGAEAGETIAQAIATDPEHWRAHAEGRAAALGPLRALLPARRARPGHQHPGL